MCCTLCPASSANMQRICHSCGTLLSSVKGRCTSCQVVQYCGKPCQNRSWLEDSHRDLCPLLGVQYKNNIHSSAGHYLYNMIKELAKNYEVVQSGLQLIIDRFHFATVTVADFAAGRLCDVWRATECVDLCRLQDNAKLVSILVMLLACNAQPQNAEIFVKVHGRHFNTETCERGSTSASCEACRLHCWFHIMEEESIIDVAKETHGSLQNAVTSAVSLAVSNNCGVAILCILYDAAALRNETTSFEHTFVIVISSKSVADTNRQARRSSKEYDFIETSDYDTFLYQGTADGVVETRTLLPGQVKDFLETYGRMEKEKFWGKRAKEIYEKLFHSVPDLAKSSQIIPYTYTHSSIFSKESLVIMRQNFMVDENELA